MESGEKRPACKICEEAELSWIFHCTMPCTWALHLLQRDYIIQTTDIIGISSCTCWVYCFSFSQSQSLLFANVPECLLIPLENFYCAMHLRRNDANRRSLTNQNVTSNETCIHTYLHTYTYEYLFIYVHECLCNYICTWLFWMHEISANHSHYYLKMFWTLSTLLIDFIA